MVMDLIFSFNSKRHAWRDLPDTCMEEICRAMSARDLAALRLTCQTWRTQISFVLSELSPSHGCPLDRLVPAFPGVDSLVLSCAGKTFPDLSSLQHARLLSRVSLLNGAKRPIGMTALNCMQLQHLTSLQGLKELTLRGIVVDDVMSSKLFQKLPCLQTLRLQHVAVCPASDSAIAPTAWLVDCLSPLSALQTLELDAVSTTLSAMTTTTHGRDTSPLIAVPPSLFKSLRNLASIRLAGNVCLSDESCCAMAALPRLESLTVDVQPGTCSIASVPPGNGDGGGVAPTHPSGLAGGAVASSTGSVGISDTGIAALHAAAKTLQALSLHGDMPGISGAVFDHLTRFTKLKTLEVVVNTPAMAEVSPHRMQQLTALVGLRSLTLACCPVNRDMCALLSRLPALQSFHAEECPLLDDAAVFALAKLTAVRHLGLVSCQAVTDIGLAALAKGPPGRTLTSLDLSGCHKNVTDMGLISLQTLARRLRVLAISGCESITDAGLEGYLTAGIVSKSSDHAVYDLERLDLSDCDVSDASCDLLSRLAPHVRVVLMEHCRKVSDSGAMLLQSMRDLREVRAFGTGISGGGAERLRKATGAVVQIRKRMWWAAVGEAVSSSFCGR